MDNQEFQRLVLRGFEEINQRFNKVDERLDQIDDRFSKIDAKLCDHDLQFAHIRSELSDLKTLSGQHHENWKELQGKFKDHYELLKNY